MAKHKQPLLIITLATMLWCASAHGGWWDGSEQQQINKLNGELQQQQQKNDGMGVVIVVLAVTTVAALGIGAAVGSRTRRHAGKTHEQ
jgi:hypothetical protein